MFVRFETNRDYFRGESFFLILSIWHTPQQRDLPEKKMF